MYKIRVTKEFSFEMAHALNNYDGHCRHIHGHSYKLFVTVVGEPITDENNPKLGMVIDFGELKRIVNSYIVEPLDHALVLRKCDARNEQYKMLDNTFGRLYLVDYQPTCENMIAHFAQTIKNELPSSVQLYSIKLHETATSFAEWYAEDNI